MTKRDDKVGYKRPPRATQFKKGQSGNPSGRPKGARNLKTDVDEVYGQRVAVTEQGRRRKITKGQGVVMAQFAKALQGDTRAAAWIAGIHFRPTAAEGGPDLAAAPSKTDEEIIEAALQRRARPSGDGAARSSVRAGAPPS